MAQHVQFVYLTQSEYDALATKDQGRLYFTSDTRRVYRGSTTYVPQRVFYGTCGTSSGTTNKAVTCPQFTSGDFIAGTVLKVKFTYTNTITTPSITVGGATKRIYWHGSANPVANMWQANAIVEFIYDGTYWQMTVPQNASTTYQGTVKLNDTLTSTSTTMAATANSVKTLNDNVLHKTGDETATGHKTFSTAVTVGDRKATSSGVDIPVGTSSLSVGQ